MSHVGKMLAACCAGLLVAGGCTAKDPGKTGQGKVSGRVLRQGRGVPLALVQAFTKAEQDRSTPAVAEIPSGEDGTFELPIAPGRYWIWARATIVEGSRELRLVGQALPNPVEVVTGGAVVVTIELGDPSGFSSTAGPPGAGVQGRVITKAAGGTGERVTLYVYRGSVERPVGPGFAAAVDPDPEGRFSVDLEPGFYTLAARLRGSGKDYGPPARGDRVAVVSAEVTPGQYREVGELVLAPLNEGRRIEQTASMGDSQTRIEGVIRESDGSPAAGVRVLAFRDARMSGKPTAVSPISGADGRFALPLPEGGKYFLGARSRLGGPASPGEKIGQHRGPDGGGLKIENGGALTGVEITVEEIW